MNLRAIVPFFLLSSFFLFAACNSAPIPSDDSSDNDPAAEDSIPDPLLSLYGNWLSDCTDFGGGNKNQLFAEFADEGSIKLAVLTWSNDGCEGPYTLSDFEGNPLTEAESQNMYELQDVSNIPENFFVMKFINNDDDSFSYGIFHILDDEFYILNDFESSHDNWDDWLAENDVSEFVDDSAGYVPGDHSVVHFNASEIPDPLASLYGNWLSDCVDFGGGAYNQIFAVFDSSEPKVALLTWTDVDCAGTYSLTDMEGNPIDEPVQVQTIEHEAVLGAPMGVFVPKITNLTDDSVIYPVIYIEPTMGNEFYELVPFETQHDNWDDWLLENDVADFVADPVAATPGDHLKFHFNRSDLPPT